MANEPTPQPKNTTQTDWRIIGVSGDTIDGREISAEQLTEMAEDYNPKVYGARINIEHGWWYWDDGDTGGLGDVIALKTEAWEQDPKKTALLAKFSVYPAMQNLWDAGRKIYTSMEIHSNFANTKRAYLTGLAITDTPASLGTTANFSYAQQHADNKGKAFSEYREFSHNQQANPPFTPSPESPSMNTELQAENPQPSPANQPSPAAPTQPENHASAPAPAATTNVATEPAPSVSQLQAQISALQAELTELKTQLNTEAHTGNRAPHTGNDAPTPAIW